MTAKEKMTAPIASVGADVEQSSSNKLTNQSIADLPGKGNLQATNNAENTAKSANKKNPDHLETLSRLVRRKLENHSLWHRSGITSVKDFHCGDFQSDRERFCIWHWKMIMQGCKSGYHRCLEWKAVRTFILLQSLNH